MFILSSVSSGLEFWSVNHISIDENSELKVFKNIIFFLGGVGGEGYLIIDQPIC